MRRFLWAISAALILSAGLGAGPAAALETFVIVPDAPGGVSFAGCYTANTLLFSRYRFSFCLDRTRSYRVRGAAHCDGRLTWSTRRQNIDVNVQRTTCRNGMTWERANMVCHPTGRFLNNILRQLGPAGRPIAQMASSLRCTYTQTGRGGREQTFTARRS